MVSPAESVVTVADAVFALVSVMVDAEPLAALSVGRVSVVDVSDGSEEVATRDWSVTPMAAQAWTYSMCMTFV